MSPTASPARRLTTHQQSVLIQVLRAFPEQHAVVEYDASTPDAQSYASDFSTIFKAVGWTVEDPQPIAPATSDSGEATGLAVVVRDAQMPAGAEALRDALRIYSIDVATIRNSSAKLAPHSFTLLVGHALSPAQTL